MPVAASVRNSPSTLGTAAWADPLAMEANCAYRPGSIWLGRSLTQHQIPLGYRDDRHVCLVSGTRGGKGTTSIIPTLCEWPGSVVVVDPKGENATITAARRGSGSAYANGMGQKVCVLDPFKAANVADAFRARFNPLDVLNPDDDAAVDEAGRIADALVVITDDSKDPFWDESARQLVKGLILHVLTAKEYDGKRNLLTVRELITRGDWQTVRVLEDLGEQNIASSQALLMEAMRRNDAFYGVLAGIGESFRSMILNSPKQFESVVQVATRNTEFIDSPGMRDCLSGSTFQLAELKTLQSGLSLYLSLPQRYMATHFRWLRMMIALTVTEMEAVPGRPVTGCPVLMLLDEFAGLQRMKIIEDGVAQLAGFGVKMFFVLQSLEQLKKVYKDGWETFLANSGLKIVFGVDDQFTREYLSKLIGDTDMIRQLRTSSQGTTTGESWSKGRTWSDTVGFSTGKSWGTSGGSSTSYADGVSGGSSQSTGTSSGGSTSENYKRPPWLETKIRGLFGFGRNKDEDTISDGQNWSTQQTTGTNKGWSKTKTDGTNSGWSKGGNSGRNQSRTTGGSDGYTRSTGTSQSQGFNESLHKRALINPDEIGMAFTRIDDPGNDDYPGLALLLMTGAPAAVVQKTNYYEDPFFIGKFDLHPDHPAIEYDSCDILVAPAHIRFIALLTGGFNYAEWHVKPGEGVKRGQPMLEVHAPPASRTISKPVPASFVVRAPYDGVVTSANENWLARGFTGSLLTLRTAQQFAISAINPYEQVENVCVRAWDGCKRTFVQIGVVAAICVVVAVFLEEPVSTTLAVLAGLVLTGYGILMLKLQPGTRVMWRTDEEWKRLLHEKYEREKPLLSFLGWD